MDLISLFITAYVIGLSGAMMPGPLLTVSINETLRKGFWAVPMLILGHALLELLILIVLVFGLSYILTDTVAGVIGLVGGSFLVWMGQGMIRDVWKGNLTMDLTKGEVQSSSSKKLVSKGALISLSNPYWSLWWFTIGITYVMLSIEQGAVGLFSFYFGHITSDIVWYFLIGFLVAKGRKFIKDRLYQSIILVCGTFLIFLGLSFIKDGFKFIF